MITSSPCFQFTGVATRCLAVSCIGGVADHGAVRRNALRVLDVLRPLCVPVHGIDAQTDDLDPALVELGLDPCHIAELGGADRREVLGMREQNAPGIAEPFMEADTTLRRIGLEIRCGFAKLEGHHNSPSPVGGSASLELRSPQSIQIGCFAPTPQSSPPERN